jgi:hypothetical protein
MLRVFGQKPLNRRLPGLNNRTVQIFNFFSYFYTSMNRKGSCRNKRCLTPEICPTLRINHLPQLSLLNSLRKIEGIKRVVVASGIRHDMVMADQSHEDACLRKIVRHYLSGQMKVAAEHSEIHVLEKMGRPSNSSLLKFRSCFDLLK